MAIPALPRQVNDMRNYLSLLGLNLLVIVSCTNNPIESHRTRRMLLLETAELWDESSLSQPPPPTVHYDGSQCPIIFSSDKALIANQLVSLDLDDSAVLFLGGNATCTGLANGVIGGHITYNNLPASYYPFSALFLRTAPDSIFFIDIIGEDSLLIAYHGDTTLLAPSDTFAISNSVNDTAHSPANGTIMWIKKYTQDINIVNWGSIVF